MLMLVLTILGIAISLVIGLTAIYYARRSSRYAEQSVNLTQLGLEVQDRQLQLQEEQAVMTPRLMILDIRFYRPEDSYEVWGILREVEQNRLRDEQKRAVEEERKRKSAEWEQEQKEKLGNEPFSHSLAGMINPYRKIPSAHPNPLQFTGHHYDGPMPNVILDLQVINKGKTAAHDISGTLRLEENWLRPLNFPGMDHQEITIKGSCKVDLVRVPELLPGRTAKYYIAFKEKHPGDDNDVLVQ